jgi:hypothetical protein
MEAPVGSQHRCSSYRMGLALRTALYMVQSVWRFEHKCTSACVCGTTVFCCCFCCMCLRQAVPDEALQVRFGWVWLITPRVHVGC